ncbi:hypothetical protein MTR_8g447350 [Medicago truncatula]|uniref:Protein FAR1-RELATED SEQUENCE n=1 Tax=Medicago truncatula TaxID=3880 RepID=A0A072TR81_MEDTR|nr:hypothetical protein MTR_8g447350 [Medicago truncatula]
MLEKCKGSNMKLMSPLQEQAHSVLTRFSFQKFQEEFEKYYKEVNSRKHVVFWDGEVDTCSSKLFEFWGILCRHILSIFLQEIPSNYLPSWCLLQASFDDNEVESQVNLVIEEQVTGCNNEVHSQHIGHCPPPNLKGIKIGFWSEKRFETRRFLHCPDEWSLKRKNRRLSEHSSKLPRILICQFA